MDVAMRMSIFVEISIQKENKHSESISEPKFSRHISDVHYSLYS